MGQRVLPNEISRGTFRKHQADGDSFVTLEVPGSINRIF